jgi:hypothetical protein
MFQLDKQKYLDILKNQGLAAALTSLHRDRDAMEFDTFEGREGYQSDKFTAIIEINEFSRELWDRAMDEPVAG